MLDFTSDTHRLNAKRDRERGGSTVRVHKSTAAMYRREDADMSEWRMLASIARVAYRAACSEARAAFTEACSGGYAEWGDLLMPERGVFYYAP